ncbi:MAG: mechanosensitive ion channel domain-containing protein, partial [Myxococcota bacterium]
VGGWLSVIASVAATRQGLSERTSRALESAIPALALALGIVFGIEYLFGLPMISVGATFAAVLIAVALAAVPVLATALGGLALRARDSVRMGTTVRSGSFEGEVVGLEWLGVRLQTRTGSRVLLPYLWLLMRPVETVSEPGQVVIEVPLTLALDTDLESVSAVLRDAAASVEGVEQPPVVTIEGITAKGVAVRLRVEVDEAQATSLQSPLLVAVVAQLRKADVVVAA